MSGSNPTTIESPWARDADRVGFLFLALFLFLPLVMVFAGALAKGWQVFLDALVDPDALAAIRLTLLVAAISVPINAVFGVAASWAIAKFDFRGKSLLISLIDLPFSVSPGVRPDFRPVVRGAGWLGPWLTEHGVRIIFAVPGIVLATVFVTFPFVARELIPLMAEQGRDDEEAARSLGRAGGRPSGMSPCPISAGPALRGAALQRPCDGRVRAVSVVSGISGADEHHAAACRNPVQ